MVAEFRVVYNHNNDVGCGVKSCSGPIGGLEAALIAGKTR